MLDVEITEILEKSRANGWVLEPDAKALLKKAGIPVPQHIVAATLDEALAAAQTLGYPVAAKVVSPKVVHKSDAGGVAVNLKDTDALTKAFKHFETLEGFLGAVVEEMAGGVELFVGAKNDPQFGPVILAGLGGTSVELYGDVAIRMAPLEPGDVRSMVRELKAGKLLTGYRGSQPVDLPAFTDLVVALSNLAMQLGDRFDSMDLNPVFCSTKGCVAADARIMLPANNGGHG